MKSSSNGGSTKPSNSTAVTPLLQSSLWYSSRIDDANKLQGIYNDIYNRNKNIPIMFIIDINLGKTSF